MVVHTGRQGVWIILRYACLLAFRGHWDICALLRDTIRAGVGVQAFKIGETLHPA